MSDSHNDFNSNSYNDFNETSGGNRENASTGAGNYSNQTPVEYHDPNAPEPGKSAATAGLVLGIIAVVLWFFGYDSLISIILGMVGPVQASKANQQGFEGGIRTAGFVLSLIGLIVGALVFVQRLRRRGSCGLCSLF